MKYPLLGLLVGLLTLILSAACEDGSPAPAETATTGSSAASEEVPVAPEANQGPVAIVNGEEITRADFDDQLKQLEASYSQQGVPFPAGEELGQLQQQVVSRLVQQTLVLQESEARGITATDEEIESEYQVAASNFPDEAAFDQALQGQGLDRDKVKGLIADNIKITKLLDSVVQEAQLAPPTEGELRGLYEQVRQQQELPPFEEVRAQLEAELQSQREDEVLQAFVQELEAAGDVEILWRS